jgi:Glyoxalase-like domain
VLTRRSFLSASAGTLAVSLLARGDLKPLPYPLNLDHLIVGSRDLEEGIARVEKLSGFRAEPSGSHLGRGTRNALLDLGHHSYLEILAPDPAQPQLQWHKEIATLTEPQLIGFALRQKDLDEFAHILRERGVACVGPTAGSRTRPGGQTYHWQTVVLADDLHGNLPFFIEWAADSAHPSADAPEGCELKQFGPTGLLPYLPPPKAGMKMQIIPGENSQMKAVITGRHGDFELLAKAVPSAQWGTP